MEDWLYQQLLISVDHSASMWPCMIRPLATSPISSNTTFPELITSELCIYLCDCLNSICLFHQIGRPMKAGTASILFASVSLALSNVPPTSYMLSKYCEMKEGEDSLLCGRPL